MEKKKFQENRKKIKIIMKSYIKNPSFFIKVENWLRYY